jgi:hypothetical protein
VSGSAPGDDRGDAQCADLVAVSVVIVAAIGAGLLRALAGSTALAPDRRHRLDQRDQLGDVVAVAAGQRNGQRDAVGLDDDVVLAAVLPRSTGDGGRSSLRPSSRADVSRRPRRGRSPVGRRPATRPAVPRATAAIPRRRSSRAAVSSRSCPSRSPAPAARTPSESRCRARTGSRTAPRGHPGAYAPGAGSCARRPAAAVRSASTGRLRPPTACGQLSSRLSRTPSAQPQHELTPRHSRLARSLNLLGAVSRLSRLQPV